MGSLTPENAERIAEGTPATGKRRSTLYVQVLVAIGLGVVLGWLRPEWGIAMKPFGDGFVKLIKMLIGPIVFTTVAVGIAGMKDLKRVGRVGGKAVLYFEVMTTLALVIGLGVAHVLKPGDGIHASAASIDASSLDKTLSAPRPSVPSSLPWCSETRTWVSVFTSACESGWKWTTGPVNVSCGLPGTFLFVNVGM